MSIVFTDIGAELPTEVGLQDRENDAGPYGVISHLAGITTHDSFDIMRMLHKETPPSGVHLQGFGRTLEERNVVNWRRSIQAGTGALGNQLPDVDVLLGHHFPFQRLTLCSRAHRCPRTLDFVF